MKLDQAQYERFREVALKLVEVGVAPSVPPPTTGRWASSPLQQHKQGHWPDMDGCAWVRFDDGGRVTFRYRSFTSYGGTKEIGNRVRTHFEAHRFKVIWDGDPGDFIRVVLVPEEGA